MAQQFPAARVFGFDLEPAQMVSLSAQANRSPANFHFVQGNLLEGLPFPDHMFDYTHQRLLVLGLPLQHWPQVVRELVRVTRPNGWIELIKSGFEVQPSGPATTQLFKWMYSFLQTRGIIPPALQNMGEMLTQNGVRSVVSRNLDLPLGGWDRHLGVLVEKDLAAGIRAVKDKYA